MSDLEKLRTDGETKYNSSLDILMRINRLIEYAETSSFSNSLEGLSHWRNALAALQREVKPYCNETELKLLKEKEVKDIPNHNIVNRYRMSVDESSIRSKLEDWEDNIRIILGRKGMALKAGRNIGTAIAGGG